MKYVIYMRVSTDDQTIGIDVQRQICHDYIQKHAQKNGTEYMEFYEEDVSGKLSHEERDQMFLAIESLSPGDIFLIARRDRMGRNVYHNIVAERKINEKKATMISVSQAFEGFEEGMVNLFKHIMDAFSEYEVFLIGARTRDALRKKKANGQRVGRIPYGYKLADAKRIVKDEHEQIVLGRMQELSDRGLSVRAIALKLNAESKLNRVGNPWCYVSIHTILKNAPAHRAVY